MLRIFILKMHVIAVSCSDFVFLKFQNYSFLAIGMTRRAFLSFTLAIFPLPLFLILIDSNILFTEDHQFIG